AYPGKTERTFLHAIAHIDLIKLGRRLIGLDLGGDPVRYDRIIRLHRRRDKRHRTLEAWCALHEGHDAIEIDCDSALIDIEVHAGAVAVLGLPRRYPERITRAGKLETAFTADRAGQRADVAGKPDVAQLQRAAARGVMQRDAAGEVQPVDGELAEIEAAGRGRPVDPAPRVEAEVERHVIDGEFGGAPLAAPQRAHPHLHV